MKLFISYSRTDSSFVDRLCKDLESRGLEIWRDVKDIKVGDSIVSSIEEGIINSKLFCIVLSTSSSSRSWVLREYRTALNRQLSTDGKALRIIPILIESCNIPELLRDIKYADFTQRYSDGLNSLLNSLNLSNIKEVPYYKLICYIEDNFKSLSSFIGNLREMKSLSFDVDEYYILYSRSLPKQKNSKLTGTSFNEAVKIQSLLWKALTESKKELQEHLHNEAVLVHLTDDILLPENSRYIHVAVSSPFLIDGGSDGDNFWKYLSSEVIELLELLQKWRKDVLCRKVYIIPESCKKTWTSFPDGEGEEIINFSKIIRKIKDMKRISGM